MKFGLELGKFLAAFFSQHLVSVMCAQWLSAAWANLVDKLIFCDLVILQDKLLATREKCHSCETNCHSCETNY